MGQLIIFEGLDGSGKGTQTKLTAQRLKEQGRDLRQITFPDYDSESSALVKMYLSGAFGDKPDDVNAYAASSFYAVDRFASYKTDWGEFYREGGLVLSDRYTTSNAVHQCSKLPPMHWDGFLNWLFDFEYKKFGIPAPDAVIYLAVDPEVSQRLITERYHGDESKKDIQEKDTEYLARSRCAVAWPMAPKPTSPTRQVDRSSGTWAASSFTASCCCPARTIRSPHSVRCSSMLISVTASSATGPALHPAQLHT